MQEYFCQTITFPLLWNHHFCRYKISKLEIFNLLFNVRSVVKFTPSYPVLQGKQLSLVDGACEEANKNGTEVHMSCSWNLCREDYQLPKGSPGRKFKGRGVLLGNQVKNQHWELRSSRTWATLLRGVKMGRFLWMCPWEWGEVRVMCPAHLFETPHDRSA